MSIKRTLRFNTPMWIVAGVVAGIILAVDGINSILSGEFIGGSLRFAMGIVLAVHCLVRLSAKRRFERLIRRRLARQLVD